MKTPRPLLSVETLRELAREQASLAKCNELNIYERSIADGMRIAYYDAAHRLECQIEIDRMEVRHGNH